MPGKFYGLFSKAKYVLLINISDRLFTFILFLLLATEFSTLQYGEVITLFTFAMIIQIVFDVGIPAYIQREIAASVGSESQVFSVGFVFTLLLFPVYSGFSYLLKTFIYPETDIFLFIIIFAFIYVSSIVNVCNKALSGKNEFKSQFYAFLTSRIYILAMFIIGLYTVRFSLEQLMLVILTGFFLNFILIFRALGKNSIELRFGEFSLRKLKPVLFSALPLGLAVIFNFMYDKIDVLLISRLKDFDQVAFYNIAYGLYKSAAIGFSFLLVTGYSHVSSVSRDKAAVREFFAVHFKSILIICAVISILLFILSDILIAALYGQRYHSASIVLKILALGFTGLGLNNLTGITLNGMGFFKTVMYITLYALILNVILNFFFIPLYGIRAAGVISAATEYFIFFMQYHYLRKIIYA